MCHIMMQEAENQSVPTGYLHTVIFSKFILNKYYSVFCTSLNIGDLELDSLMKRMLVSQMT